MYVRLCVCEGERLCVCACVCACDSVCWVPDDMLISQVPGEEKMNRSMFQMLSRFREATLFRGKHSRGPVIPQREEMECFHQDRGAQSAGGVSVQDGTGAVGLEGRERRDSFLSRDTGYDVQGMGYGRGLPHIRRLRTLREHLWVFPSMRPLLASQLKSASLRSLLLTPG